MADKKDDKTKKGLLRTLMYPLEKRLLLDASTLATTVNAIPNGVLNLDAQDIDGDGDFSAGDQPTNGTDVQNWEDKFGGNNDASQGTASRRATYESNAFGTGIGGLVFDGDDTYDIGTQTGINNGGPWPEKSFAVVFRTGADTSGFQVVFEQGGSIRGYQVSIDNGNIYAAGYNNTGSEWGADRFKVMNLGAVQANTTYRVIMVFDANTGQGFIKANLNGGAFVQLDEVGSQTNHTGAIGIGAEIGGTVQPSTLNLTNNTDTNFFKGSLGQIMLWNTALDDNQVRAVDAYLTERWTNRPAIQFNTGDTVLEGGSTVIDSTELYTVDRNTPPSGLTYQVTDYLNGTLQRSGVTIGINGTFTQEDIDNGIITFLHDDSDTITANFSYRVTDGGNQDTDTFVLNVIPVNDPGNDPASISINTVQSVVESNSVAITSSDLLAIDADTTDNNLNYTVTSTLNGSVFNTNTGTVVTAFTQQDINNGFIRFDHDGTVNGFAGFDFDLQDGPNTTSGTKDINVTFTNGGGNDPPVITVNTGDTVNTGGTRSISNVNLRTSDPDNSIDELIYTITSVSNGTVLRSGATLTVGSTFTQEDINFGIISFTHDGSATTTASIGFNVTDGNTNVTGNTYDFGVIINNPPNLGPNPAPVNIFENTANGTLIFTANASDIEGDSITYTIQSGNGLGIFQINPINGQVTIDDNTNLDFEGTNTFNLVIRATDDGAGTPFDEYTLTINVQNVNEDPNALNNTITILEDNTHTFSAADFGFSDPDDAPASNSLQSVLINTIPTNGTLELSGVTVTAGQEILATDLGNLVFTPGTNENGVGYDSFNFQLRDDGGTANGGVDLDTTPNTITFDVTPLNDAPDGADITVSTNEDTTYNFTLADFSSGFSDADDTPSNTPQSVVITTLPANGILELSGVAITAGQEISAAQVPNITFTPVANENGVGYTSFTYQVRDNGGTANGGVDLDPTPNTVTIDVNSVNDEPEGADNTITIDEDNTHTFAVTDFGFTDANDPSDNLQSVTINTLPANGVLELSGVAVTAGQVITAVQIPNLVFIPAANESGTNYANFTFQVTDDGGTANGGQDTDQIPNTITFDVNNVNDEPAGADNTLTIDEDTSLTFAPSDFGFSDVNDGPDNFQSVIITTLPANGVFELSGVAVTAGQEIAFADIPNLTFTPTAGESGTNYANFTFQVRDDGGTAIGGQDTDQTPNNITIDVNNVNDEPDGADNTITLLENGSYGFAAVDFGFTDPNDLIANNFQSVFITTLPVDGVLELSGVVVTAGQEIAVADIPNLVYTPTINENGAGYTSFDFQVRDDGGTANGGQDTDQTPNTITFDVDPINSAPDGTDNTVTTLEDTNYDFTAADFGYTDVGDTPANNFLSVIITTLPTAGTLELSGVAVTAGQEIAVANIPNLSFIPVANENGAAYDAFTFQVRDDGGTIGGGIDTDQSANTMTIDVTPVNDAPDGADITLTTLEDAPLGFTAADFGFTDVNDAPDNFQSIIISAIPTNGTLELSGVAVTAGQEILVTDLPNLFFVPAANANGAAYDTFDFQVRDDGGTPNGGQDTDQTANTVTIDVTSVNDAPDGTDTTVTTLEDTDYTFDPADFGFTDVNDTPANNFQSVIITTLPTTGTLNLSGVPVTAGQEITFADIPNLTFTPVANENGAAYDAFTFQVRDDGGTADGGVDLDQTANTMTIDVTSVNDEPDGTDNTLSTLEDTPYIFNGADFGFTDVNDGPDNFQSVIITTLPADGILELSGVAVTAGQEILAADIPNLTFTPAANEFGVGYADFTFQVRDDGGTSDGGIDIDPMPNTITFDVTSINDEPDGTDATLNVLESNVYTFSDADFGFTDVNDGPDNFNNVIITTLPATGVLELSGVAVTAGQVIAVGDIPNLTFTPVANENGVGYTSFDFQVQDDGGTPNGGQDTDQTPNTITFDVDPINSAPDGTDNTVTTLEDTNYDFTAADFGFSDVNDIPSNILQSVIITTLPTTGTLELSGVAVTAGQEIALADIPNLSFVPVANENGAAYDAFTFQVRDDGGTANGGIDLDAVPNTMTIDVLSVNDAPDGADITLTTLEDAPLGFTAADFGFTDVNDAPDNFQSIIISAIPTNGTLELSGVAVTAGQEILVTDLPNLFFVPAANANGAAYDTFDFQVRDDGGTPNGGQDTDQTANTVTIDVTSVNDAPDGTETTVTTLEDTDYTFDPADFGFTDVNDTPANNFASVVITTLPTTGTLNLSGVAVTAGQEITFADIPNLTFTPVANENGAAYDAFTFQVRDDGGTADGGVDLDQAANTMTIDVTSVNDEPDGTDNTLSALEDVPLAFDPADFGFTDVNDAPNNLQSVIITTLPADGILELSGVAVTAGQEIAVADIPNLTFTSGANEFGVGYADFTFQVRDDDGTLNGGVDLDSTPNTMTIDVAEVNDEPEGADNTLTFFENSVYTFSDADFGFTDVNDGPDNFQSVFITTLPATGALELSGVAVTAGQEIAFADIPNLTFTPLFNENGAGYADFTFQVRDDGGTPNGGIDTDQTPNTITFDVTPINSEPDGTDNTVTTLEDNDYIFDPADFGFTDVNDAPASNILQSVIITTLPTTGTLNLSGVAVTAGQEILAADIPNLTFTPIANENGAAYDAFTFQVRDDGGTANGGVDLDAVPNTMTIDVLSVNDAPDGADITLTTLEDAPLGFTAADFGFTDVNDAPDNFQSIIISAIPTNGTLELSGVAVTAGQEILVTDLPNLFFVPAANANGAAYDTFDFQVRDDGGTPNGGQDTDQTANTVTIDVTSVNDAPDGTDTTVTTLEDTDYTFDPADFGFTDLDDVPSNNFASVVITTLPTTGTLNLSGVAVTAGQEITFADIPNLTFTPVANENGAAYDAFTFQVRDDGGTADGGIDLDQTANTMTIDVTSVNDEPDGTDNTLSALEDVPLAFDPADFGFTDVNDAPNNLQSVIITTLPVDGILEFSGVAVTAGQEIAVADIPNLTFTSGANEFGVGYADFTFQVRDDDGTLNGGVDLDSTPNTITIDVAEVNDAPDGADITLTTLEDTPLTFDPSNFGFTDVNDGPDNFQSVFITTLPTNGILELSGVAVSAGQEIAVADIPNLTFTPALNDNGLAYDTFDFQVRDDGGTPNGGQDTDQTPNTVTIDVTSVNDEPDGTDNTVTTLEDNDYVFDPTDFGLTDVNDNPANNLQSVIITTLPTTGTLNLSGVAVTAGQEITFADIPNLTFTPVANENGAAYDAFTFQVRDDGGTADGGIDLDAVPNTMTIDVTSVNDAPDGADNTLTTLEDTPYNFDPSDFGFSDVIDSPANNFQSVVITTLPTDGVLELSGVAVTAGQEITVGDIPNLTFTPSLNDNGISYTDFTYQVRDDGGTTDGGIDLDPTANTITFDVTSVNDEPDGTDTLVSTNENIDYIFTAADFGLTDVNDTPANALQSVIITTLPVDGVLELSGVAVTAGQEIAVADIPNLIFIPVPDENGPAYADFTFQVRDDGGTADGGIDLDSVPNTITIDVVSVNDAPEGTDTTLTINEDTPHVFSVADFGYSDPNDIPPDNFANVIITTLPVDGVLELSGVAVTAGQSIAIADIPNLTYTPTLNEFGTGYADFTFQVQDDGGTNFAGIDTDQSPNTITFDVLSVNDEPEGTDNTLTTLEDTTLNFDPADFGFTDVNDGPDNLQSVIITTLPTNGILELSGVAVIAGQEIAVADIPNLTFDPAPDANGIAYDSFTFQVRDDGGTPNGGQDTDQTPNTMTIDVTPVDDAPVLINNNTITLLEGDTATITNTDLLTTDIDSTDPNLVYTITVAPINGFIALTSAPATPITSFTQDDLNNNLVTYVHDSSSTTSDSFDFTVEDGTTVLPTETFDFTIVPVNDAPYGADNTLTTLEDTPLNFAAADFGFTDPDDSPSNNLQSVVITTLPANGILELSGVAITAGQEIAVGDIPNLTFTPDLNANGLAYTGFTFQVRDDGTTLGGGVDLDQTPNTMTIDVTSVNDAPEGTDTTVTTLEDTDYIFNPADFGFTDPADTPANNFQSVIISTLPTTGTLNLSGVAVTAGQEITVADIPNLTFTPLADENGAGYDNFTYQVRDDGGTVDGGIDLDATPNTMTIDVTSVNDAPDGTDTTLTALEDIPYNFDPADFGLTDPIDTPANNIQSVIITTLPVDGILELSGVAVTAGQEISVAQIPNLTFTSALNEFGTNYTDFTFQVRDDGGTADGGIDLDPTPNTITFDVTQVDDPPEGTDNTVTTLEDTDYTFDPADFGFTDTADTPADNFTSVIITTLPTTGTLNLSGVAVTAGQDIALADIPNLTFTPLADENGLAYDTFTFQVRDDSATNNTDVTPNVMTIDVTPVDDAPILDTNAPLTLFEGDVEPITTTFLSSSDIDSAPADIIYTVTTSPVNGQLELTSAPGTPITSFTQEDLDNGLVVYAHDNSSTTTDSFVFEVSDATTNIGAATFDINILQVNDAPYGADNTLTLLEDTSIGFTAADFGFSDPDDAISDDFQSVIITTLPSNGTLELSGVAVTAGQEIAVADIPNLLFTPVPNENGVGYGNFTFQVRDDGGVANGGVDIDPTPNTMAIDVTSVNDEPDGTDNTINFLENAVYTFAGTDFGLTDPNDNPANNLNSVIITTLPTVGTLELSGVAVTAGQEISAADIPNLTFTPVPNGNGTGYDAFTFQVRDDDGTANGGIDLDSTPNTITFDVEAVNSAPYGTDNTLTTLEDTAYNFDASEFGFSDPDDVPSDDLQSVIITTLPADGILELSGIAVTAGQNIALADIPNLSFTPTLNEFGTGYTNFTFQVVDDGETVNGVNTDQSPNTITFDVTEVNDAPDGTDVTLTTLEDTPLGFTPADFDLTDVNDTPADNLQSIIITTIPTNGTLELSGVAVTAGQEITAADIPNLSFVPALDENGVGYDNFTFQVRDDGGTANGGIDLDPTPNTVTIDVTPVNDAPDGTDNTVTTLEDIGYTFDPADFGLTDLSDVPANNLQSVIISTLPADGVLELSGVAVTAGQEIAAADIPNLVFTPAANENGNSYANFDFQVRDDGGTANAGIDLDATPNTMTIDVTPVNDAPDGTDNTVVTLEDTPLGFTAADFGFSDTIDSPSDNFQSIIITNIPSPGTLELSGVAVTAGQEIQVSDLPNLFYVPFLNDAGIAADAFDFQVRDDGGTANGGIDTDQTPNTITIDITPVNEAPQGADATLTALEDTPYVFNASDFGFTDVDDVPANNLASVIINTLPTDGILELSGVAVTAGQEIAVADLPNLTFTAATNEFGTSYADFDFQVRDDGGTANGGVDLDQSPNTITFDVLEVNDAPDGADNTLTTLEDTTLNFTPADFGFSDVNDTPADNFQSVVITTIPTNGSLQLSGVPVIVGQEITVADIANLTFDPALNEFGNSYDSFDFQVRDDGGTPNGGQDLDQVANTITVDVISVNDAPEGTDSTVTAIEDTPFTFTATDFGYTDPNDASSPNNFDNLIITTIPTNGILELSGVAVTAGQIIAVSDIPNLVYTPASNVNGLASDGFTFQVQDDGGTANGGIDTDQSPNAMTIDVTSVNDEPAGTDNTVTTLEDTGFAFNVADFGLTDISDSPANNLQSVIITTLPTNGVLELSGVAVTAGQEILAADIPNLVFTPALNEFGTSYDNFDFQVRDDGGTTNGGVDLGASANTMTIEVIEVNDAPDGADNTLTTLEDTPLGFIAADFGYTDVSDTPADNFQDIVITTLPTNGTLELSGVPVIAGQTIAVTDLPNLFFTPALHGSGFGYDSFAFAVVDDGGTANGGIDTDVIPNIMTIDVTPVNDAPDGTDNTVTTNEDIDYTFAPADFGLTDINDVPANNLQSVIINTLPVDGQLLLSGVAVTAGQEISATDIPNLVFRPVANEFGTSYANFDFQVRDDGGTANGGIDLDPTSNTMTIDVNSVNDEPEGTDVTLSTLEDTPLGFNATDFGFSDVNDGPDNFNSIIISSLPTNGTLELSGVTVTLGQEILVTDLPNLFFTPALNDNGTAYDTFDFQVRDDGGTPNGGIDTDQTPNTVTIDVVSVNDAPAGTDNTVTTNEDIPLVFTLADFGFTDTADNPANNFNSVIITTIPMTGTLELSGVAITAGQEIAISDIPNLVFTPVLNEFGTNYDNFTFQVRDDNGTANGGADLDATPNLMTIDVNFVNDAPDGLDNTITILEDTPYTFNNSDFGFSDVNDTPADNFQGVRISSLPTNGTLTLAAGSSSPGNVSSGQVINLADIPFLTFTPDLNDNGIGYAEFTFQVQDDGGSANGGVDFDSVPNTITFNVTPVNDAPYDLTLSSTFLPEGISTWNIGTITGFDVDGPSLTYTIVSADPSFSISNGNILTNTGTKTFGTDPDTYSITLRVSDGFLSYDETFTITLLPEPVTIDDHDPAEPYRNNNNTQSSLVSNLSQPRLEFYIRDFMEEIRNGEIFRYGNQGLIDSSLSSSDVPMKDVFYGMDGNGIDEIIKRNIITRLQDLAANILDETGVDITTQQLAEIFGLDAILVDMVSAGEFDDDAQSNNQVDSYLYETNSIYKALLDMNNDKDNEDDEVRDEKDKKDIAEESKKSKRQYLHEQLDEAALYYQSKNAALIKALNKGSS